MWFLLFDQIFDVIPSLDKRHPRETTFESHDWEENGHRSKVN